ncbi:hypothetical protein [Halorubrum ezzemoulense]|uniref:hypothetical protein n=1 Tax=Halorubrum ezzemoulense TaxID=337243 RepID=UPI001FEA2653|nr:hypothetical protein [Halorubrum ezzemoulense]
MSGIELRDETLSVDRALNQLDELAIAFSDILDQVGIEHVYIAGYVSILAGRARSTEDVDVLIEPIDEATADTLTTHLEAENFWGPAMPLSSLYSMLENGDPVWVAPTDQITPHLEVTLFSRLAEPGALVPLARQKRVCMKTVLPSARGYQNLRNLG